MDIITQCIQIISLKYLKNISLFKKISIQTVIKQSENENKVLWLKSVCQAE